MDKIIEVDIFFEDRMQVELVKPIISRISEEHNVCLDISEKSVASGSHGKGDTIRDLKHYFKLIRENLPIFRKPDMLVVAVDTNCDRFPETKKSVTDIIEAEIVPYFVIACPYPHVEKWYLNDLECFNRIVGFSPSVPLEKCERGFYKNILQDAIIKGDNPPVSRGEDFARDIAHEMDFYEAGKRDSSFKHFINDLSAGIKLVKANL